MNRSFVRAAARLTLLVPFLVAAGAPRAAESVAPDTPWRRLPALPAAVLAGPAFVRPFAGQALELDEAALRATLAAAPREGASPVRESKLVIALPRPDGTFERFAVVESPVMQPGLQARSPEFHAYLGQGLDRRAATLRLDVSPLGVRAMVLDASRPGEPPAWYVDPVTGGDTRHYTAYFHGALASPGAGSCTTPDLPPPPFAAPPATAPQRSPDSAPLEVLRNEYGIAIATTGEFSVGVGQQLGQAPTVNLIKGVIQTTINRVNLVLERDGPVRLLIVNGNDQLIYLDPSTDPYDPSKPDTNLQQQFQDNINAVLGTTSYSLGHTFHWQASGYRGNSGAIGTACNDSTKALGFSATSRVNGDMFMVDVVAHEIGHQLGALHTFNGLNGSCGNAGQYTASSAYEPASGSTIMSYGGSCGTDDIVSLPAPPFIPSEADGAKVPMYNLSSMIQIANFVTGTGCVARIPTGNLHPGATPAVQGPFVVPTSTPFRLIAPSAEYGGPNDVLTYSIEEFDLGPQRALGPDTGWGEPLLRVLAPSSNQERRFPRFATVLNGTASLGENLPLLSRTSGFRGVLRDNVAGAGGWGWGDINVQFAYVPPPGFRVTAPPAGGSYCGGQPLAVTWNVAGTNAAPINAATVDILMSTDNGQSFAWTLAAGAPNTGTAQVSLPFVPTTQARVEVQSAGGLFFHVNAGTFEVANAAPTIAVQPAPQSLCQFGSFTLSYTPGPGSPRHSQWFRNDVAIPGATGESYTVDIATHSDTGDYKVVVTNGCGTVTSNTVRVQVGVSFDPVPPPSPQACHDLVLPCGARGVGALSYAWLKDGGPLPGDPRITGGNGPALTIGTIRYEDEGRYRCRVTDQCETGYGADNFVALPTPAWAFRTTAGPIKRGATTDLAYDASRRVSVLYGGSHPDGQALGDTWEWDGVDWLQRNPPHGPGPRTQHEMVYDTLRKSILLFSGYGTPPQPFNNSQVWSYDGDDWTLLTTSPDGPPPNVALQGQTAFDSVRGKMVTLYQGPDTTTPTNNTWEFDSATAKWALAWTGAGPEFNNSPIAFDAARGITVGQYHWTTSNPADARTWTYAGAAWTPAASVTPPRYNPLLAYDATRRRVTMYGCCRGLGPGDYHTDTWAFEGEWNLVLPDVTTSQLDAVIPSGLAYDATRRAMVMVGSAYNDPYYGGIQTWEYRYRDRVTFDRHPANAGTAPGGTVQFKVFADGAPSLAYRWRRGTTDLVDGPGPGGSTISGATTSTLTISSVSAADEAGYSVAVTNLCGRETSATAGLAVAGGGVGRVPGDKGSGGKPLKVARSGASLALTWSASCRATDTDYEVYEGAAGGNFRSHVPLLCSTGGATSATVTPGAGNRYYLVVPRDAAHEGSYGIDSKGLERARVAGACLPQQLAVCP